MPQVAEGLKLILFIAGAARAGLGGDLIPKTPRFYAAGSGSKFALFYACKKNGIRIAYLSRE
jgi:hypothetical protein